MKVETEETEAVITTTEETEAVITTTKTEAETRNTLLPFF
jgi:hypothetical protein